MTITQQSCVTAAAAFKVTNVMVAGVNGTIRSGYSQGLIGTLTPDTINGETVTELVTITSSQSFQVNIPGFVNLGADFFTHVAFESDDPDWDNVIFATANATFSFATNNNSWTWTGDAPDDFNNGETYDMEII